MKHRIGLQLFPLLSSSSSSELRSSNHSVACSSTRKQITIFYNALDGECDTSELQALAILCHARGEMEEKYNTSASNLKAPSLQFQLHSPYGLSLRKSLQRFLQKRKERRIQAANPY
ncbi:protein TIFY 5A [Nicotiana tabacum]|uniref:Jasmonate ZIM-domain protein 11b n=2 Tax=Nicotiana TaxID=4085 RepID=T1WMC3_TOBAC|nr:PREDICTED: protein TIFY 5A-like [Nicotiana sylvestris]XP_016477018.1 PREDICTED: protein TIFY 5A-like [Nicotiana tabacum]AGU37282.1 jasmonate ZIM-domain protein 11b [Nicotiana tabacum]